MSTIRGRSRRAAPLVVGVDIGGTKTAILVCEPDGSVRARHVAPTAVGTPDRAADAIDALVRVALDEAGATLADVAAVGVGVPGRVDPRTGDVRLAVNLGIGDDGIVVNRDTAGRQLDGERLANSGRSRLT